MREHWWSLNLAIAPKGSKCVNALQDGAVYSYKKKKAYQTNRSKQIKRKASQDGAVYSYKYSLVAETFDLIQPIQDLPAAIKCSLILKVCGRSFYLSVSADPACESILSGHCSGQGFSPGDGVWGRGGDVGQTLGRRWADVGHSDFVPGVRGRGSGSAAQAEGLHNTT